MTSRELRMPVGHAALHAAVIALVLATIPMAARALVTKTCLTGTDPAVAGDPAAITAVRRLVDTACPCPSFDGSTGKTHRNYAKCAAIVINAQAVIPPGTLRPQCKATVKKYYVQSTCGVLPALHALPCIRTTGTGKITCAIKPTTKKDGVTATTACVSGTTFTKVACGRFTHCIDAADTDGNLIIGAGDSGSCVLPTPTPTATPTVSTPTETPTSTPTLPAVAPTATPTPNPTATPFCGDGVVNQPAEQCDPPDDAVCAGECRSNCACPPTTVSVPDVVGLTQAAAMAALTGANLTLGPVTQQLSATVPAADVISQDPIAGTTVPPGSPVTLVVSQWTGLPPDPSAVAPPVDASVATTIGQATAFLYTGANPIQTGVAPDTIVPIRAAVLRGRVLDKANAPLPGVTMTILYHPELGHTLSRADGMFDLAVNGGGLLTLNYAKTGFLSAQRQLNVPWQDFALAPDVVLIPQDTQVTTVDLTSSIPIQVARGSVMTDSDGTRQATLLFPQGTQAAMVMPDGSTQPLTTLSVRATEFTVGPNGPQAMPADMPPNIGYTYAVVFTADEAQAAGAKDVVFAQPIPFYVENFLNFPVGSAVPLGAYDPSKGVWVASDSGRIVKILGITGGLAQLDTDGDGVADNGAALGVTTAERQQLATLYPAGQSLWRVLIPHFDQPWDANWGVGPPPADAGEPNGRGSLPNGVGHPDCGSGASIIECENQVLGEAIPLVGTALSLNYRSNRVPDWLVDLSPPFNLTGPSVPASLESVVASLQVAGLQFNLAAPFLEFPGSADQTILISWDGRDAYGRQLYGSQLATVSVGFVFGPVPYQANSSFGSYGNGTLYTTSPTRQEITIWRNYKIHLGGSPDPREAGMGGWTLEPHHVYEPVGKTLYRGDGTRQSVQNEVVNAVINTIAGTGTVGFSGDGGPATQAKLSLDYSSGVTVTPDGSVLIADTGNHRIRRVGPDGRITTIAGTGTGGFSGDGGPATQARLNSPTGVALAPDDSVLIADYGNLRVRRVGPDGTITTVAGTGTGNGGVPIGDGGPATQAQLIAPIAVAVTPEGSLLIAEDSDRCVRRVGPDGKISTLAGICGTPSGGGGDGGPASQARLSSPRGVAVAPDGSVLIADYGNNRVRRVGIDGKITTIAGTGSSNASGDGGPAIQAGLSPENIAVAPDGSVLIADRTNNRLRRIDPDGFIATIAGNGISGFSGDGGPPTQAQLQLPGAVAVAPDGSILIVDFQNRRIRKLSSPLPGFNFGEIAVASDDGRQLYRFDAYGRHLNTVDTLTAAVLYRFDYTTKGQLAKITDGDGNVTTLERDASGVPTAIVAPFGQRTILAVDANGYLARVTNPAGEAFQMTYTAGGLLTRFTDPRSQAAEMTYDGLGRLLTDTNAAGGSQTLVASLLGDTGLQVALTSALNRTAIHRVENLPTGDQQRVLQHWDGTETQRLIGTNGSTKTTLPDGSVIDRSEGPDPRFGMQASLPASLSTQTGGLTSTVVTSRTATLTDPTDPLSLISLTHTVNVNGRTSTGVFNAATKTLTRTSAGGRQSTATIDTLGRPTQAQITGLVPINASYDNQGHPSSISQGTGADARTLSFSYNNDGYLQTVTDPLGRTMTYQYDAAGRIAQQTLPDGRNVLYGYDANGNLTALKPPGRPVHGFAYTPVNLLDQYTPPALGVGDPSTRYTYNLDKQLTQISRPDGQALNLGYDSAGRFSTLTLPTGQISYTYDATTGKLNGVTAPDSALSYTYNGALLAQTAWSGTVTGNVSRGYDNDFRVTVLSVNGLAPVTFSYDADSLLTQAGALALQRNAQNGLLTGTVLGLVSDARSFNGFGEWTSYSATAGATPLFSAQYTRDQAGRVTQLGETIGGTTATFTYSYDLVGRLTEVKKNGVTTSTYAYDANGNRLTHTTAGGGTIASYDAQDRLTEYGATTFTYTANGDLLSATAGGQTTSCGYDVLGNLRSVTLSGGTQIEYLIDGRNRRIGKKVNSTNVQGFLYQSRLEPIAELDGNNTVISTFVYGSRPNVPDYMVKGGATYRIIADHLGSPRLVVDTATGAIAQQLDYDEFGIVQLDTNPGFQPFGFAGGLYDRDTQLVRFGARDYDARVGRWTSKDAEGLAGGLNLYPYVGNDPINFVDLTGKNAVAAGIIVTGVTLAGPATVGIAYGVGKVLALGVPIALGFLEAAALESSAIEHADETGDDEGPNEGGAPPGVGDKCPTFVPTGKDGEVGPNGDTGLPERPLQDSDPTDIPGAGNPRKPGKLPPWRTPRIPVPDTPEDGFPELPPGGTFD